MHSKFIVPIFMFETAKIVPALNISFHCGLLPVVYSPWFIFFDTITMVVHVAKLVMCFF